MSIQWLIYTRQMAFRLAIIWSDNCFPKSKSELWNYKLLSLTSIYWNIIQFIMLGHMISYCKNCQLFSVKQLRFIKRCRLWCSVLSCQVSCSCCVTNMNIIQDLGVTFDSKLEFEQHINDEWSFCTYFCSPILITGNTSSEECSCILIILWVKCLGTFEKVL